MVHTYLQVPVLFKLTPVAGPLSIFLEAGPAASLHLKTETEVLDQTVGYDDDTSGWDLSAIAGAGVAVNLQAFIVQLEARYDYGLKNLSQSNDFEIKSKSAQVLAGVTVPIK